MTRVLFFFTTLFAMLATLCAILIRTELAYPGVSPLFLSAEGIPNGRQFLQVSSAHQMFAYLSVVMLGATMASAAKDRGALLAGLAAWIGVIIALAVAIVMILAEIPLTPPSEPVVTGWVLYPPLSTGGHLSLLDAILERLNTNPFIFADLPRFMFLPATVMVHIGAFAMISTQPRLRWVGVFGAVITVTAALYAANGMAFYPIMTVIANLLPLYVPLIIVTAFALWQTRAPWLVFIFVGAITTTAASTQFNGLANTTTYTGTMTEIALLYTFPLGLAWFALLSLVAFRGGTQTSLTTTLAICGVLAVTLSRWVIPMATVGLMGMPSRYVDYPAVFEDQNQTISLSVLVFTFIYLALVILVRRART